MSLGIVAQRGNERAVALAGEIRTAVDPKEPVKIDTATASALGIDGTEVAELDSTDLVVSIGGDGTFLFTARNVGSTPIVGVNLGEVGFLNAVSPNDAVNVITSLVDDLQRDHLSLQVMPRLVAEYQGHQVGPALNEIVICGPQRGRQHQITLSMMVDGREYTADTADGLLVATATGSTAYNLSEQGPLLMPTIDGLVVNVMCGRTGMPPLVIPPTATVEVVVSSNTTAFVIADGRLRQQLAGDSVTIEQATTPVRIAGPPVEFFDALNKLDRAPRIPDISPENGKS